MIKRFIGLCLLVLGTGSSAEVAIFGPLPESGPVAHGVGKLKQELVRKGVNVVGAVEDDGADYAYYVFAGLSAGNSPAALLLDGLKVPRPKGPETLQIRKTTYRGKSALILCGGDEAGLMYALLDTAERISWAKDPSNLFEHVVDIAESPDVKERAVSIGTFNRTYFESRLHDPEYWTAYFDMMAANRLNQFILTLLEHAIA